MKQKKLILVKLIGIGNNKDEHDKDNDNDDRDNDDRDNEDDRDSNDKDSNDKDKKNVMKRDNKYECEYNDNNEDENSVYWC